MSSKGNSQPMLSMEISFVPFNHTAVWFKASEKIFWQAYWPMSTSLSIALTNGVCL
jgi:hypothetical protein